MFTWAKNEQSIEVDNFLLNVTKPVAPPGRERRLVEDEEERLFAAAAKSNAPSLGLCITLAIETGMREGNIADLHWEQIDFKEKVITLKRTKNGDGLNVPLSVKAEAALLAYPRALNIGKVTGFYGADGLGRAFRQACKDAGIVGLNFHDLRHEAASRIAPFVPSTTLCKIMGWKSMSMANRYYNPLKKELVTARLTAESARAA
jgi:integrase